MDLDTKSSTIPDQDGNTWLRLTLDVVHCVTTVIRYGSDGNPYFSWTCSTTGCTCTGSDYCIYFTLEISRTGTLPENVPTVTDCKYGDTLQINRTYGSFSSREIAVVGKQGEHFHIVQTYYLFVNA